jgi:hypothetical protein
MRYVLATEVRRDGVHRSNCVALPVKGDAVHVDLVAEAVDVPQRLDASPQPIGCAWEADHWSGASRHRPTGRAVVCGAAVIAGSRAPAGDDDQEVVGVKRTVEPSGCTWFGPKPISGSACASRLRSARVASSSTSPAASITMP